MRIAFRVDASLQIGSGHVMRCLTLAEALKEKGAECLFLCREHPGHLLEMIRGKGFAASALPVQSKGLMCEEGDLPAHYEWLGTGWETDAGQCADILSKFSADWVVVDHYALDHRWENQIKSHCQHLLVLDDLADRSHSCDLLLDQNLGRKKRDYQKLVPEQCQLLIGPQYSLLRPEFSRLREYSLNRRISQPGLKRILITMGGVDKDNATGKVLAALENSTLPEDSRIEVVMGATAPWLESVSRQAALMPWTTEVSANINDMASRMAAADLAIGAAGSTSWERCCLGLPTLMGILAENQLAIGKALNQCGAAILLGNPSANEFRKKCAEQIQILLREGNRLRKISAAAARLTDGRGCQAVIKGLEECTSQYSAVRPHIR